MWWIGGTSSLSGAFKVMLWSAEAAKGAPAGSSLLEGHCTPVMPLPARAAFIMGLRLEGREFGSDPNRFRA